MAPSLLTALGGLHRRVRRRPRVVAVLAVLSVLSVLLFEWWHHVAYLLDLAVAVVTTLCPARLRWVETAVRWLLRRQRRDVVVPGQGTAVGQRCGFDGRWFAQPVTLFAGVPYAVPSRRFGPPTRVDDAAAHAARDAATVVNAPRWLDGDYALGTPRTVAPQPVAPFNFDGPVVPTVLRLLFDKYVRRRAHFGSERHCLQLDIWTPERAVPSPAEQARRDSAGGAVDDGPVLRPVFFFLHGGAFLVGSAHQNLTNGAAWPGLHDAVCVSANYRMGALGFLKVPGPHGAAAPPGLQDQLEALRWVKRHIARFGGDPNNVTLAGQSAGAMSVGALLGVSALYAEPLCHRVVMYSGTGQFTHRAADATAIFERFAKTGVRANGDTAAAAEFLRTATVGEVIRAQNRFELDGQMMYRTLAWPYLLAMSPWWCRDSPILPRHPLEYVARLPPHRRLPTLMTYTDTEYTLFTRASPAKHKVNDALLPHRLRATLCRPYGLACQHAVVHDDAPTAASDEFPDPARTKAQMATLNARVATIADAYRAGRSAVRCGEPPARGGGPGQLWPG